MRHKIGVSPHGNGFKLRDPIPDVLQHMFFKKNGQPGLTEFQLLVKAPDKRAALALPAAQTFFEANQSKLAAARAALGNPEAQVVLQARHYVEQVKRADAAGCASIDDFVQELAAKHGITAATMLALKGDLELAFGTTLRQAVGATPPTVHGDFLTHIEDFRKTVTTEKGKPYHPDLLNNICWQIGRFDRDIMQPRKLTLADLQSENGKVYVQDWANFLGKHGRRGKPMKAASAEVYIINVGVYWNWLRDAGKVKERFGSPFRLRHPKYWPNGIKVSGEDSATVLPYEPDQIAAIIHEAVQRATAPLRDNERMALTHRLRYLELGFAVWIMGFTGMRVESVALMTTKSIVVREGIRCVHVPKETGKTPAGQRDIPIHPFLAPLIDHLLRQADARGRLFRLAGNKRWMWRDDIEAILDELGIDWSEQESDDGPLKVSPFHSFRHSFAVAIKDAPENVNAALLGHVIPKQREPVRGKLKGPGGYASTRQQPRAEPPKEAPMRERAKWIERIMYPGLWKPWTPPRQKGRSSFETLSAQRLSNPAYSMPA